MTDDPLRPIADQRAVEAAEEASARLNAARQRLELGDKAVTQWTIDSLKAEADRLAAIAWPDQAVPATASTSIAALLPVAAQLVAEDKPARPPMLNPKIHAIDAEREIRRSFKPGDFLSGLRKAARKRERGDPMETTIFQIGHGLQVLADKAGKVFGNTYEMIADKFGPHPDTVLEVVRYLLRHGVIFVYNTLARRGSDNRLLRDANMYLLLVPQEAPAGGGETERPTPAKEEAAPPSSSSVFDPLALLHRAWDYAAPLLGLPKRQEGWNTTPVKRGATPSPA